MRIPVRISAGVDGGVRVGSRRLSRRSCLCRSAKSRLRSRVQSHSPNPRPQRLVPAAQPLLLRLLRLFGRFRSRLLLAAASLNSCHLPGFDGADQVAQRVQGVVVFVHGRFRTAVGGVVAVAVDGDFAEEVGAPASRGDLSIVGKQKPPPAAEAGASAARGGGRNWDGYSTTARMSSSVMMRYSSP